ncbi:MAG: hypothetical protein ACK56F_26065 [bacterium]
MIHVGGVNRNATYRSGSGSQTLLFAYTIADGDTDFAGGITAAANALNLNGGTIQDGSGTNLVLNTAAIEHPQIFPDNEHGGQGAAEGGGGVVGAGPRGDRSL